MTVITLQRGVGRQGKSGRNDRLMKIRKTNGGFVTEGSGGEEFKRKGDGTFKERTTFFREAAFGCGKLTI